MPKQLELTVSYSLGVKANLGNYESGDAHISKTEKWDVSDLKDDEIVAFESARYVELHKLLGPRIEEEYREMKNQ